MPRFKRYYVWHDEGRCDNVTDTLEEAKQICDELNEEYGDSYVTDEDNRVVYVPEGT